MTWIRIDARSLLMTLFLIATCLAYGCQKTLPDTAQAPSQQAMPQADVPPFAFNEAGELLRPTGYRTWVFVGSPLTPNDLNDGRAPFPEFHNVYIDPDSYAHYEQTGQWRDGTILIKELVSVGAKTASSGKGYFQGEFIGLEATIKSAQRFPEEPGNWGYFSFTNEDGGPFKPTAKVLPKATCNVCHGATAERDFVFTQYYPVLRALKSGS